MHLSGPIPFTFEGLEQGIGNKRLPKRESGKTLGHCELFSYRCVHCAMCVDFCIVHCPSVTENNFKHFL